MKNSFSGPEIPPPLELECLKALWRVGQGSVKDVRRIVTANRNLAYTTVMTVLDRLEKRGTVERKKIGRSFIYTPVLGKDELRRLAVNTLVDTFFDGSKEELLAFLEGRESPASLPEPVLTETLDTELL